MRGLFIHSPGSATLPGRSDMDSAMPEFMLSFHFCNYLLGYVRGLLKPAPVVTGSKPLR